MVREKINSSFENYVKGKFLLFIISMPIIVSLSFMGCMSSPTDKQTFADTTAPVWFAGAAASPNYSIVIEGYTPDNGWEAITETATGTRSFPQFGNQWYMWGTTLQIEDFWYHEPASVGHMAKVQAKGKTGGLYLVSMRSDPAPGVCLAQNRDIADFITNCSAESEDGSARLYTADYRDFGQECVDLINELRDGEGLGLNPLQRFKEKESCMDNLTKWAVEHEDPHPSANDVDDCDWNAGQNSYIYGILRLDGLLNRKIKKEMFNEEKANCLNDPTCPRPYSGEPSSAIDCYHHNNPDLECGHYLNMIREDISKAACGLYEEQIDIFSTVINFYK